MARKDSTWRNIIERLNESLQTSCLRAFFMRFDGLSFHDLPSMVNGTIDILQE